MATTDEEAMEGHRGGLEVVAVKSPIGTISVGKATDAVIEFLRTTRVGCRGLGRVPPGDRGEEESGVERGPGPP